MRNEIRLRFRELATISTQPTSKGLSTIDWLNEYFAVKRLQRKPITLFEVENSDQFALLQKAESEGFIKSSFSVPRTEENELDAIGIDICPLFISDDYSSVSQKWNHQVIFFKHGSCVISIALS